MSEQGSSNRDSVWSQFHSPVLENATAVELEGGGFQDKVRQVEIRKVRQSIEEMSVLLAEMQQMYRTESSRGSDKEDSASPSDEYVSAADATSPALQPSRTTLREQPPVSSVAKSVPQIQTTPQRESLRASLVESPRRREERKHEHARGHAKLRRQSQHEPVRKQGHGQIQGHAHPQPHAQTHQSLGQSHHPTLHHAQRTPSESHKPREKLSESVRSATLPSPPRTLTQFTKHNIEERLRANELSIDELDLPATERKLLERFINALSKLSIELQMDQAKRVEGRRRMNIALNALEGWI